MYMIHMRGMRFCPAEYVFVLTGSFFCAQDVADGGFSLLDISGVRF